MKESPLASLWMVVASALFACMGACVKLGASHFSAAELVFWRGFVALVLIGAYVFCSGNTVATPLWRTHLSRSLSGFVSLVLYFLAITTLPLATAVTLSYTSPLWLAALVAVLAHERFRPAIWGALTLGMLGVALLLKPALAHIPLYGAGFGLIGAAIAALAYLNVRKLGEAGEPEWRTVFWFSLICAAGGLPFALFSPHTACWSRQDLLIVLGVGGLGAAAQLAMTRAYGYGKTLVAASLSYSTVIFSTLLGTQLFGDHLDPVSLIGILIVIASGVLAGGLSRRQAK